MVELVQEAKLSLKSFLAGAFAALLVVLYSANYNFLILFTILVLYAVLTNLTIKILYEKYLYDIAVRGLGLGLFFSFSWILITSNYSFQLFGWYCVALAFFHWSEYFTTACYNPKTLSIHSYLLDHSTEYHIAAVGSLCEFAIEWYFFPEYKQPNFISVIGAIIVIGGEFLRKLAMITAATNFNHYVQYTKAEGHQLVTDGIYSWFRHPSYVGWFYWSLGTQLMICNPICLVGYVFVSWRFFKNRICEEEITLLHFFGEEYATYQENVPTGLPFISGYKPHTQ